MDMAWWWMGWRQKAVVLLGYVVARHPQLSHLRL